MKIKDDLLNRGALSIIRTLQENKYSAYFAGGCVRDMILELPAYDIDIATSALPDEILEIFPKCLKIGEAFGIINVVVDGINYEVATFREEDDYRDGRRPEIIHYTDDPEKDAARRDFTINAMFYEPFTGKILDFFDGQKDLKNSVLQTVGEPMKRFNEDYLRILRAVRFAVRFGLTMSQETADAVRKSVKGLHRLSGERIRDELNKIFIGKRPDEALEMLFSLNLLDEVLPEVSAMYGVKQSEQYHPEGDVFTHTKLMLSHMPFPDVELAWSVLLHDVGKPGVFELDENAVPRFYCHESLSAEIAENILTRLKFSNKQKKNICTAVKNHMKFAHVDKMKKSKLLRLMTEETFSLQLELHRIDCISSHKMLDNYVFLLDKLLELNNTPQLPPPLLNGYDLIKLGFTSGPQLGEILNEIRDLQLEGTITSKEKAISFAENLL